ncbi:Hypothetical predicted protein [Olea europaea subsp. europaea]|uniref:Cardiomyopathy-associated protein 5 n=2 Tax=Olea europaea subsp. europaea TaxID=158383 RepID=A0A8S0PKQ0_OLEEU|nr:Hypothetical predicted protein [Olea europaea subsp. europaea]
MYIIFPSVFWFLIYLFPFIVSTAVIFRIFPSLYKRDEKNNNGEPCGTIVGRNGKSLVHVCSVRRRRAKDIRREDDNSQNNVDEKSTIFSMNVNYDLVDKHALVEEYPKEIREVEVDSSSNPSQCSYLCTSKSPKSKFGNGSYGRSKKFNFGRIEIGNLEDSEDEEEAREAGNKAVEWIVDDQKNLMDLGISEIERNKRLESLIARRKARKLFSLQVRRTLRNMSSNDPAGQIAHITIPKNNLLRNNIGQFSPGPGSAPSVLIPMRNPFDLPYDPFEEKPDLTRDSFNQEFMAVQIKDVLFCRHESFSLGAPLPKEFVQDCAETSAYRDFGLRQRALKGIACSKPGCKLESKFNGIVEPEPFQEPKSKTKVDSADDQIKEFIQVCEQGLEPHNEIDNVEVQTKPIPIEDINGRPSSSSSSEEDELFYKIDKDAVLKSIASPAIGIIAEDKENNGQTGDHSNYDDPHFAKTRLQKRLYYANKTLHHHTRALSIPSDLQVEFSEVSCPQTHDEDLSYQDEEISIYDMDLDKEITSSSEDLLAASSHLSGIDENESEVHEISDKDIMEVGFSRINKFEDKTLSNTLAKKVTEQNSIGANSFSPSKTDFSNSYQGCTTDFNAKIHGELQSYSVSAQEPSDPCEKLKSELSAICDVNGSLQYDIGNQSEQSLTIDSDSTEHIGSQSEKQDKCCRMLESTASISDNRMTSEDSDNRLKKDIEHEEVATASTPFEDHNNLELLQHTEDQLHSSEVGTSGTSLVSDDPQAPVSPMNEQIPADPSLCTSPQSVLQQNFSMDNLSEFQQNIQMEIGQFNMVVENNMLNEIRTEVSGEILSQSSMPSEDSNYPRNGADIEQESSHHQEKPTGEVDTHIDIDEPTNYEDQMQNVVLCEDTGHENQLNYPMDCEECSKATTSESYEVAKIELQKFADDRTPIASSILVEENGNSGTHKKSEEDEEAIRHANTYGSTLGNAVKLEISTSNGESRDETILLGVPKERSDTENSIICVTTDEPSNSSSRSIEESTSVCIVNKPITNKRSECSPEGTYGGFEEESKR